MDKKFVQATWRAYSLLDKTLLRKDAMTFSEFCKAWNDHLEWIPERKSVGRDLMVTYYNHYLFDNYMRKETPELLALLAANDQKFPPVDQCEGF